MSCSSSLSSSTITLDPISSLHPSLLFPFFHSSHLSIDENGKIVNKAVPTTAPTEYRASNSSISSSTAAASTAQSNHSSTTSSNNLSINCCCQLGAPAVCPTPTFINIPSANPHQTVTLPIPIGSGRINDTKPCPCGRSVNPIKSNNEPSFLYSHGTTQVDTSVPLTRMIERTLYSWTQLTNYTIMNCANLPAQDRTSISQSVNQTGTSFEVHTDVARLCPLESVHECPGHPWIDISYTIHVRQWQEPQPALPGADLSSGNKFNEVYDVQILNEPFDQMHMNDSDDEDIEASYWSTESEGDDDSICD